MAGYLFQCRLALYQGMLMARKKIDGRISIERFDDVAFENDNHVECLIQAKHHIKPSNLTNNSSDLWKTIRIWAKQTASSPLFPIETKLLLLTTATAPPRSAAELLRPDTGEDERERAFKILQEVAKSSTARNTEDARNAFLDLGGESQRALVRAIEVYDNSPTLSDMRDDIEKELIFTAPDHVEVVADQLEGWWFSTVANSLVTAETPSIPVQSIVRKVAEVGALIRHGELPLTLDTSSAEYDYSSSDENLTLVRQMRIVEMPDSAIKRGVRDYYRAQAQRSQWARENLLLDGENKRYDDELFDQWGRKFDEELSLSTPVDVETKKEFGKRVCFWAMMHQVPFRNVIETWITSGSFQALADRLKIGWHPDYQDIFVVGGDEDEAA